MESSPLSVSDIAAVTRDNDGMNGNGAWWILVILLALGGWGRNGNGFAGSGGGDYALATDFATLERKMDGINGGLCDGFYAQNTNMLNGFSGVQNTLAQGFAGLNTAMVQQGYETRQGVQAVQNQMASCCCDLQRDITAAQTANQMQFMQAQFQNQQNHCETVQAIHAVQDNLIKYMTDQEMQKLRDENLAYRFAASQADQNNYLVNTLRPMPVPAYQSCNPWASQAAYGCCSSSGCC